MASYDEVAKCFKKVDTTTDVYEFDLSAAYEEVRRCAYLKWENAGRPAGRETEFWLEAELEVSKLARDIDDIWYSDI